MAGSFRFTQKGLPNSNDLYATASARFIQSKWVPNNAFQQYYTLDKNIGFKNGGLLAGGTYQANGPWLPGGGEKTGTGHIKLNQELTKKVSIGSDPDIMQAPTVIVSRDPAYDACTHIPDSLQYMELFLQPN